jgi:hypothetical protein
MKMRFRRRGTKRRDDKEAMKKVKAQKLSRLISSTPDVPFSPP